MHFTIRQLEAFAAASEFQSFTRTAAHLHLTPSAVSQLVLELESAVGYKLFDRHTRKVELSPAGRSFLPVVRTLLRDLMVARAAATDIRNQASGIVRVAAPQVVASAILPELIASYRATHPKVSVRIRDCAVDRLVECVASREADLALGPDVPVPAEVERIALFPSEWVVWCAARHRFARKRSVSWRDLHKEDFIAAGRDYEIQLARVMGRLPDHQRFAPVHVVDNVTTALGLAAANLCFTLSPAYVAPMAQSMGLQMRKLEGPGAAREMSLFRLADRSLSPAAGGFGEHVVASMAARPAAAAARRSRGSNV